MRTRTAEKTTIGALLLCLTAVGCGVVTSAPRGSGTAGLSHPSPSASTPVAGEPATGRSVPPAPVPQAKARGSEGWRISRPAVDHQIEALTTATSGLPGVATIKSIGETFAGFKGISGAADLGDQRTILVLDVGSVISEATRGSA